MTPEAQPIHVALELYSDGPALSGQLWLPGGRHHPFTGWTGLAAALSLVIDAAEAPQASDNHDPNGGSDAGG